MALRKILLMFCLSTTLIFYLSKMSSCTHDADPLAQISESTFDYGENYVAISDGYVFDKTHSSVRWETAYLGSAALLTGRFNDFEMEVEFDESNLSASYLSGKITLSSVNTGEPGRDAGCLLGTFGIVEGDANSDVATFTSTEFKYDDKGGFDVDGVLKFHGVEAPVTGKLEYVGTTLFDEASGVRGAPLNVSGFIFEMQFAAKSVFGIQSSNISDNVKVIASGQFKQSL